MGNYNRSKLKATFYVSLSDDGMRPDYRINGQVERKNSETVDFDYQAPLYRQRFRHNPFYERLFSGRNGRVRTHTSSRPLYDFLQKQDIGIPTPRIILSANLPLTASAERIDREIIEQYELYVKVRKARGGTPPG
uniref:Uncharacterized protein n=1 Tax=Candidatus Kentrum sp. FW TaxID=2126338 RepID=A0A450S120_9GAMM|nr:MAG: hypothetical protein BECKFW1821A_GA0114235_100952 [Candidatus Kentron sp. FW]